MRDEIQVPEQEGVEHRSEMMRLPLLCFVRERERERERERFGNYGREWMRI